VKPHMEVGRQIFADLAHAHDTASYSPQKTISDNVYTAFTGSRHPWLKDFVGQDKTAEYGVRSQPIQSSDR